ncbi:alanine racemase [Stutzerimonas xanthomarina]|uniref:Alanine racemase n=2 Tax=Stutzerimonas xanthomarina TaxID=271420 RepID=A0A1M5KBJ6_9GAMM|nr:alanine racemase [Stutzerimonas xanthomarina]MCP9337024.1 alanine racemase [Stutzerimonas xanthomarina]SEI05578.1 alanine racemase [Stutzerimonas xanthomarina]SHG50165.1 alanine racemase [Stutzerimonas xanthomarina DSM 18231]
MRPLVATVDLAALRHNYQLAKQCAPRRKAFAVVKANAYGHGAPAAVECLRGLADGFAVASLEEAEQVRSVDASARLLLLEGCFEPNEYAAAAALGLDVTIQGEAQLDALLAADIERPLNLWLKLDSGMHRLGFSADALRRAHARLQGAHQVAELNLMSHFACADERGNPLNEAQLEQFSGLLDLAFDNRSFANSAAVLTLSAAHMDWLRPGIMLYGASPFAELSAKTLGLKPVMTLTASIIAIRDVEAGASVGYGAGWVAQRASRIATVSCGYADGYPRTAPPGTCVSILGQRAPLAGRVSMDMLAVDITDLPPAGLGDAVELWGNEIPIDELAQACGTIGYELLTKVTQRVPRRYING